MFLRAIRLQEGALDLIRGLKLRGGPEEPLLEGRNGFCGDGLIFLKKIEKYPIYAKVLL